MKWFRVRGRRVVFRSREGNIFSRQRRERHKREGGPPWELVLYRGRKSRFVLGNEKIFRLTGGKVTKGVKEPHMDCFLCRGQKSRFCV